MIIVCGGHGTLLAKILTAHPRTRGTLFDQPQTIARAQSSLASLGLSTRCQAVSGNFFAGVPEGGDADVLKWILHDWDDTASVEILRACRRAMKPDGALIVFERLVGPPNTGSEGKFSDLNMLVMNGGRERTRDEFAALFGQSGFRLVSSNRPRSFSSRGYPRPRNDRGTQQQVRPALATRWIIQSRGNSQSPVAALDWIFAQARDQAKRPGTRIIEHLDASADAHAATELSKPSNAELERRGMTRGELLTAGRPSRTLSNCIRRIGLRIVTWAKTCADYYATAVMYEQLSTPSDAELSRRGLSRATLAGECALHAIASFDLSLQGFKRDPEKVEPTFVERLETEQCSSKR